MCVVPPLARRSPSPLALTLAACVTLAAGCTVPIAGGLDEGQANRVVVALDHAGVGGEKESDPASEGQFRVLVERDEAPRAIAALERGRSPRAEHSGVARCSWARGRSCRANSPSTRSSSRGYRGELERTLAGDRRRALRSRSLVAARDRSPARRVRGPRPTASVLLKHRGAPPHRCPRSEAPRGGRGARPFARRRRGGDGSPARLQPVSPIARSRVSGPISATRGSVALLRVVGAGDGRSVNLVLVVRRSAPLVAVCAELRATAADEAPELRQPRRA